MLQSCNKEEELLQERPKKEMTEGQCPINRCNPDGLVFSCKKENNSLSVCLVAAECPTCTSQGPSQGNGGY